MIWSLKRQHDILCRIYNLIVKKEIFQPIYTMLSIIAQKKSFVTEPINWKSDVFVVALLFGT